MGNKVDHFHLSALMCPAHRSSVLEIIKQRLKKNKSCKVISTQLVEAGVDVDFPVVLRSLAGIDSIAQSAGRCNRNGKLHQNGQTYIFQSEHLYSERFFTDTASCAKQILEIYDDPLSLEAVEHYFKLYYWDQNDRWDSRQILQNFKLLQDRKLPFSFQFDAAARKFNLIENYLKPVIIPWHEYGQNICNDLRRNPFPQRELLKKLQRYTVQIPERIWNEHLHKSLDFVHNQFAVLNCPDMQYSEKLGLCLNTQDLPQESFILTRS
jgi:hypothetical protein